MSKKSKFIEFVNDNLMSKIDAESVDPDVIYYWQMLSGTVQSNRPPLTDNGKMILKFLQEHSEVENWKAKDIAEIIGVSSRTVAGGARKLFDDGFIEKLGQEPTFYALTEKGKNIIIED